MMNFLWFMRFEVSAIGSHVAIIGNPDNYVVVHVN